MLEKQHGIFDASPYICAAKCDSLGFTYSGIQSGKRCVCGDEYGKHGEDEKKCQHRCHDGKVCGGSDYNSVYTATGHVKQMFPNDIPRSHTSALTYVKCIADMTSANSAFLPRVVNEYANDLASPILASPSWCVKLCGQLGFIFAGVQEGGIMCTCGNRLPGEESNECDLLCESGHPCGGKKFMFGRYSFKDVYIANAEVDSSTSPTAPSDKASFVSMKVLPVPGLQANPVARLHMG
eukprot:GHVU01125899.1.p1 GENE.GHVU01125899.1~~GHVU01125899.1.p1  ORF type:complete len:237 (+),score=16.70 GHVU01125899.1:1505-2215(+)